MSIDLGKKFQVYRRNEVKEYVVWRVLDNTIDWFYWHEGNYLHLEATPEGVYKSRVFPGLWLDAGAIVRGDFAPAHTVLQQGLQSQEHTDFVARLQKK